jgi:hypothetical protein
MLRNRHALICIGAKSGVSERWFPLLILAIIPILIGYVTSVFIFPDLEKVTDLEEYNNDEFNKCFMLCTLCFC